MSMNVELRSEILNLRPQDPTYLLSSQDSYVNNIHGLDKIDSSDPVELGLLSCLFFTAATIGGYVGTFIAFKRAKANNTPSSHNTELIDPGDSA